MIFFPLLVFLHSQVRMPGLYLFFYLLWSTKGDLNPNLQIAITHAQQICSLVLPLAHDVIWSTAFRTSSTHNLITRAIAHPSHARNLGKTHRWSAKAVGPSIVIARIPQPSVITNSFSLPASLMVLFCLGSPHASRIGQVFEAIEGAVPQSPEATGSNFKQEMVIRFVGHKRVARTQINLKKTAICVQAKGCLRCHISEDLKNKKMKVKKKLWNIKTETGQIVRGDKIWSFSRRFFPSFRCLSLTVKWLNAKHKCWSNGKRSDHSTRDSSSPSLSFSFHFCLMKGNREYGFWNSRNFACEISNPGLWNQEYRSRNPDYTNDCNPESKVPGHRIWNPVPAVRNPEWGIQNPRSSVGKTWVIRGVIRE